MASLDHVNHILSRVSNFLRPLLPFVSCHMVDYLTANHWETLLPPQLRQDLLAVPEEDLPLIPSASLCLDIPESDYIRREWSSMPNDLQEFLAAVRAHSLPALGVITPVDKILEIHGSSEEMTHSMRGIMSEKKSHEVEVMSRVIAFLARGCGVETIVDLGSGRGYLSSSLALQYGLNVVAVDSSDTNTSSALIRNSKLEKHWESIKRTAQKKANGEIVKKGKRPKRKTKTTQSTEHEAIKNSGQVTKLGNHGRYVGLTKFITEDTDLEKIVNESFASKTIKRKELDIVHQTQELFISETAEEEPDAEKSSSHFMNTQHMASASERIDGLQTPEQLHEVTGVEEEIVNINSAQKSNRLSQRPGLSKNSHIGLVGLHTCGNLASSSLRLFKSNAKAKFVCNVGCCYHLIEEEFSKNPFSHKECENIPKDSAVMMMNTANSANENCESAVLNPMHPSKIPCISFGFPLSSNLRRDNFSLGRNSRMLSSQPADRLSRQGVDGTESLYWRSLLQVILLDKIGNVSDMAHVGRIATKCQNFVEYFRMAVEKLGFDIKITDEEIEDYYNKHADNLGKLKRFFLLRASVAPVIEGLILLDRLAFLFEHEEVDSAYLVQLFDSIKSPRCHAVVAVR